MKEAIYGFLSNKRVWNKLLAFIFIIMGLLYLHDMLQLFFLTFIIGYLIFVLSEYLSNKFNRYFENKGSVKSFKAIFKKIFGINVFVTIFYIALIIFIFYLFYYILPKLISELKEIPDKIPFIKDYIKEYIFKLEELTNFNKSIESQLDKIINERNIGVISKIVNTAKNIGTIIIQLILSIILSYICVIERKQISNYFEKLNTGLFSDIYNEIKKIFRKIFKWFGLIFKAQFVISLTNTILTTIGLIIIGYFNQGHFPYLLTLTILVFIMGFIPVAGTFISSIPILLIGFMFGGIKVLVRCLLLIIIIHTIEAYILNPKIVGSYVKLPMGVTFIILIISEHIFGMKGLLIGIPIFFIIMDLITDLSNEKTK